MAEMTDHQLRMWCLEMAFRKAEKLGPSHLELTNAARDYFDWVKDGRSQGPGVFGGELFVVDHAGGSVRPLHNG